jgi:hypothetical protein
LLTAGLLASLFSTPSSSSITTKRGITWSMGTFG